MNIIDCSSSRGPHCLWLPCKSGGRNRMIDSTILEFISKHCKQAKRHDCAGLDFEVVVCVMWSYDAGAERIVWTIILYKSRKINRSISSQLVSIMTLRWILVGKYDDLLEETKSRSAAYLSTAKLYIPKMYNALMDENKNISPEDARDRIEKDCVGIWTKRTILRYSSWWSKEPRKAKIRSKEAQFCCNFCSTRTWNYGNHNRYKWKTYQRRYQRSTNQSGK